MGRRSNRAERFTGNREITLARQAVEFRWRERLTQEPTLAAIVTARGTPDEAFHRWIRYKQGFSPALVRRFLAERADRGTTLGDLPVLDPFAGSGTVTVECARQGVPAVGVEAMAPLVFLAGIRHEHELPPFPDIGEAGGIDAGDKPNDVGKGKKGSGAGAGDGARDEAEWKAIADRLTHPLHRAALMLAVSRRYTSAGRINRGADPLSTTLKNVLAMIREDLRSPLPTTSVTHQGDARQLAMIDDESIGAILTSPPYLSRHDYTAITAPLERVYRHWFPTDETDGSHAEQTPASTTDRANQMSAKASVRSPNRAAGFSRRDHDQAQDAASCGVTLGVPCSRSREHVNDAQEHDHANAVTPRAGRSEGDAPSTLPPSQGGAKGGSKRPPVPEAAREAADELQAAGEAKLASVVRAYFVDFARVVTECHRVLAPGGVAWFVVGGARLKGVHIPSDIIVAEQMQNIGFTVNAIRVAREVTNSRRKFANLGHIAPHESVIVVTKR